MADYSKDLYDYTHECMKNCSAFDDGYKQGATDMEKVKQIIIDKLQEQIPKWHLVSEELPSDENDYLLYFKEGDSVLGWYSKPDKQWTNSSSDNPIIADVIAWMELPKFEEFE